MAASADFTAYVLEQLAPVGRVRAARLFGGVGLSRASVMFGIIMDNTVYLVVDDASRARYEAAGMRSFAYEKKKGRVQVRRFFELPESVLDDPDELRDWAEEALRIASRKRGGRTRV